MVAARKARRIPVAGADRLALVDQIAGKDLIALAEFLVLPEDDLSLAIVLKSPLFDLDDDDLTERMLKAFEFRRISEVNIRSVLDGWPARTSARIV